MVRKVSLTLVFPIHFCTTDEEADGKSILHICLYRELFWMEIILQFNGFHIAIFL